MNHLKLMNVDLHRLNAHKEPNAKMATALGTSRRKAYFTTTTLAIINRPTEPRIARNQRSIPCTSPAEALPSAAAKEPEATTD
jgi:hypothetical protein